MNTEHILWIGGPSGSGKSTVARQLARRHGLRWYSCDTRTWEHRDRALQAGNAGAKLFERLSPSERATASREDAIAMSLHAERELMVLDDLRALPRSPLIVADGTLIRPRTAGRNAIWLMASPQIQRSRLQKRQGEVPRTAPMWRDVLLGEIAATGRPTLNVDDLNRSETVAAVERIFAERIASGPTAKTTVERRRLLRQSNLAIVIQYRAGLARPWATASPETTIREFDCECARPGCAALVDLAISAFPDERPVLAPGH